MRLGILALGQPLAEIAALTETLAARGIDVVHPAGDPPGVRDEAERLRRADCDGVLLAVGAGAAGDDAAEAALFVTGPVLVVQVPAAVRPAGDPDGGPDAVKILRRLGTPVDTVLVSEATPDGVEAWLRENAKTERQRGGEAALKLYGLRLMAPGVTAGEAKFRLLAQFGILARAADSGVPRPDDISAPQGDGAGEIAERLLRLVAGSDAVRPVSADTLSGKSSSAEARPATVFGMFQSTSGAAFQAVLLRATQGADGEFRLSELQREKLPRDDAPVQLFGVAGDHFGAVRVACNTLDIAVILLR